MNKNALTKKVAAITQAAIMALSSITIAGAFPENVAAATTAKGVDGVGETLSDRAMVAFEASESTAVIGTDGSEYASGVYLSWRSLQQDNDNTTFTVYRNDSVIVSGLEYTNFLDTDGKQGDTYKVIGSNDTQLGINQQKTTAWGDQYVEYQLYVPSDQEMPDGSVADYSANDMSVGDLDGDGNYELIVKWYPSNAKDNSETGYTGTTFIDAYDIDMNTGTAALLWRIDMGLNIRSGAHYTQFQVWDFNGDGKADIAIKTADGTTVYVSRDGTDQTLVETGHVGAVSADELDTGVLSGSENYDYRDSAIASSGRIGYILDGDEYFTIIDGSTGEIFDTVSYEPARGTVSGWGDAYGNRVDRFTSCVAYLDGADGIPYAVFNRGYYTRMASTAYYLDGSNNIQAKWKFDTDTYDYGNSEWSQDEAEGQGNHAVSVNDIDGDGKDEIILGSLTLDDDGLIYNTTGYGHGDALHVSDWVSWNDGLEIMQVHEEKESDYAAEIRDAKTGQVLMGYAFVKDTGRGMAGDIDPASEGAEWWASYGVDGTGATASVYSTASTIDNPDILAANTKPSINFSILWDGDLLTELQDHVYSNGSCQAVKITKWDYENKKEVNLLYEKDASTSNTTKGNVGLAADICGDWREEIIVRTSDNSKVRIYTTNYMTDYVIPTLMQNQAYRIGIAWQNVGYNQPAHTDYLISEGVITAQLTIDTVTDSSVQISFTEANDGNRYGYDIDSYEVYRSGNGGSTYDLISTMNADELVFTDSDVETGTTYRYRIASVVNGRTGYLSKSVEVTTDSESE